MAATTQARPQTGRTTAAPVEGRLYELDLARFVAAAGVVAYHYLFLGPVFGVTDGSPSPLAQIARYGFLGVDFFFILSGFVIMMSASNRSASSFSRARIVRLYPVFWVCVLLTASVRMFDTDVSVGQVLANMTMFPNEFGQGGLDGSYWSLAVELRFYALVAVAIRLGLLSQIDRVLLGWISYCVLSVVAATPELLDEVLLTGYAHYFVAGAVLYQIHRDRRIDAIRAFTLAASVILALSWVAARADWLEGWTGYPVSTAVSRVLVLSFFAIMGTISWHGLPRLRTRRFAALGAASYPLYLLHQEIGFAAMRKWGWSPVGMAALMGIGLALAAHLIAQHVEPRLGAVFRRLLRLKS